MPRQAYSAISPVIAFVRGIEGDYLTLAEVARMLSVPDPTLRKWRKAFPEKFNPTTMTYYGQMPVYLYSLEDLERVRVAAEELRRARPGLGRPRRWSVPEQRDRQCRQSREYYLKNRAIALDKLGQKREAARYRALAKDIRRGLDRQKRERDRALE